MKQIRADNVTSGFPCRDCSGIFQTAGEFSRHLHSHEGPAVVVKCSNRRKKN
jgi:hypothetical protein